MAASSGCSELWWGTRLHRDQASVVCTRRNTCVGYVSVAWKLERVDVTSEALQQERDELWHWAVEDFHWSPNSKIQDWRDFLHQRDTKRTRFSSASRARPQMHQSWPFLRRRRSAPSVVVEARLCEFELFNSARSNWQTSGRLFTRHWVGMLLYSCPSVLMFRFAYSYAPGVLWNMSTEWSYQIRHYSPNSVCWELWL
jgi:hypothetical protein